jgi:hypothetical protein
MRICGLRRESASIAALEWDERNSENGMSTYPEPSAAARPQDVADDVREDDLQRVLQVVPRGAFALCAIAVALLIIFWLAIYFGIFLPRGPVS